MELLGNSPRWRDARAGGPAALQGAGPSAAPPVPCKTLYNPDLRPLRNRKLCKTPPQVARQLTWPRLLGMALDAARGLLYLHTREPPVYHRFASEACCHGS